MSQLQNKMEPDEPNYNRDCNAVQSDKYVLTFRNNLHSYRGEDLKFHGNLQI
jgi:hypothetical protein